MAAALVFAVCALWLPLRAVAQSASTGTLLCTVVDSSGGVLPGAEVTVVNARTATRRSAATGPSGACVFPGLASGDYRLQVEARGFRHWESGQVHLSPGDSLELEARLALLAQTTRVEVTANAELVRTDQGAREGLVTPGDIRNLSTISRGAMELVKILPGTVTPDQSSLEVIGFNLGFGVNNLGSYSVNGSRGTNLSPVLDGSKIVDFGSNSGVMVNLNPDMVDEVKIQTSNYAAEYGSPHVQITAVTKSGSASFHGSAYDYVRNWRWNANDRSNNYAGIPRPQSTYQYPGFSLSGPLLVPGTGFNRGRDKLFFFVGYEYQHQRVDEGTKLRVVPTAAQRRGDFSELCPVFDAAGYCSASAGNGSNLGQPTTVLVPAGFPGAGTPVPHNALSPYADPHGQAMLGLYPLPNGSYEDNRYNYAYSVPLPVDRWQLAARVDWNASAATHAYVRLALEREKVKWANGVWGSGDYELPSRVIGDNRSWSLAASVTSVLSPTLTNEVVLSATRFDQGNAWEDPGRMQLDSAGLGGYQGVFPSSAESVALRLLSVGQQLGDLRIWGPLPIYADNDSVSLSDTLSKVKDAHTLKLGLFVERGRKLQNANTPQDIATAAWIPGSTGNDYGDLLAGRLLGYDQQTVAPDMRWRFWNLEGFVQDTWKVRRNLTLDAGLRIARFGNNEELNGLGILFDPAAYDPTQGMFIDGDPARPNGILTASRGQIPKGMTREPGLTLMPRLNFSWSVDGDGGLVLRGGAGLFYNRPRGQYFVAYAPPNVQNVFVTFMDVPDLTLGALPQIDPAAHNGSSSVSSLDPGSVQVPRTWTWSLALAKRLPWQQTIEAAYVGNRADHLMNNTPLSYVPPGALTGTYGNADLDNPIHRAALDSSVLARFRLYPAYDTTSTWYQYEAWSNYNALQVSLSRQASRRFQYYLNYTFGKALGVTGDDGASIDPVDARQRSYGLLPQDRTHIFNASYNVLLPDVIGGKGPAVLRHLLNGWQVSGITRYASGAPFRVVFRGALSADGGQQSALAWYGTDAHGNGFPTGNAGAIAPVFTADPRLGHTGKGEKMLDVSRIAIPALGESGPFQQPYDFRLPSRWNFDLSLLKNFALGGARRLQLRVGAFNLFNQAAPTLDDVDLNLNTQCNATVIAPNGAGSTALVCDPTQGYSLTKDALQNFGRIKSKHGHRVVELALRFDF